MTFGRNIPKTLEYSLRVLALILVCVLWTVFQTRHRK